MHKQFCMCPWCQKNVAFGYDAQKCRTHLWCSKNDPWNMTKICCTYEVYNVENASQQKCLKKLQAHMISKQIIYDFQKCSTHLWMMAGDSAHLCDAQKYVLNMLLVLTASCTCTKCKNKNKCMITKPVAST